MTSTKSHRRLGIRARLGAAAAIVVTTVSMFTASPAQASSPGPAPRLTLATAATPAALPYAGAPRLTSMVAFSRVWATKRIPYVWGGGHGSRPGATRGGFDCSGWVRFAYYNAFGVDFGGGTANDMVYSGRFVRTTHPVPGDVVAFNYEGGSHVDHVGLYVGGKAPDGRPAMIDAPHTGANLGLYGFGYGLIGYFHYRGATAADSGPLVRATSTSISVKSTADKNEIVSVTGRVTAGSTGIASGVVRLYGRSSSDLGWSRLAEARPVANGTYNLRYRAQGTPVQLFVRYLGSSTTKLSDSAARGVGVTTKNTATTVTSVSTADYRQSVNITGRATGSFRVPAGTMRLYTRTLGGAWKTTAQVRPNASGYYTFRYLAPGRPIQYMVRFLGTTYARSSDSPVRTMVVTVHSTATTASVSTIKPKVGQIVTVKGRAAGTPLTANRPTK